MGLVKYVFVVSVIFTVFTSSHLFRMKCPTHGKQRVVNGSFIVVDVAEEVVAPEGTTLLLNSTVTRADNERICINKTMETGKSHVVQCIPPKQIKRDFEFINVFLREQDKFLVLIVNETSVACNALYTWWSEERGILGNSIVSIEDYNKQVNVLSRRNRTTIFVHGSNPGTYADVSLVDKKHDYDIYNYQFLAGTRKRCYSYSDNIIPLYEPPYCMSLFKSIKCPRDSHYLLGTTDMSGSSKHFDITFHFKATENVFINAIVIKEPTSIGDSAEVVCEVHDVSAALTWKYHKNRIENNAKYNITEIMYDTGLKSVMSIHNVSSDDTGKYWCSLRTECGLEKNTSVSIKIREMKHVDNGCPTIASDEAGDKVTQEEVSGEASPYVTKDRLEISSKPFPSSVEVRCTTTGNITSAKWLLNGRPLKNDGKKYSVGHEQTMLLTLSIKNPGPEDTGQYACRIQTEDHKYLEAVTNITFPEMEKKEDYDPTITPTEAVRSAGKGNLPFSITSLICISLFIRETILGQLC